MGANFQAGLVPLTVATAAGNKNSNSFKIGGYVSALIPTAILCPSDLKGVATVKVQLSPDGGTNFYDILSDGTAVLLKCVVNTVLPIPDSIQAGASGWTHLRLVTDANPSADIVFVLAYAAAEDENAIFDDDQILGSRADVAVTDATSTTATEMAVLKGLLKIFNDVWDPVNHWIRTHNA